MTVSVPSLDDLAYDRLLADVTARIPGIDKEWTDHSPTEPGVVMLELLCWLTESAIWRLDQVSPAVLMAMLDLLDPRATPRRPGDPIDAALVEARQGLRELHRAVTVDDYRRLLAANWPERSFAVHSGKDLATAPAGDKDMPGHVSVVVAPAVQQLVARVRLASRQTAWVFPVEHPGLVGIDVQSQEGTYTLADSASAADILAGAGWVVYASPAAADAIRFTLVAPDGRLRAEVVVPEPQNLSIRTAGEAVLADDPVGPPPGDGVARCSLLRAPSTSAGALSLRLRTWPPDRADVGLTAPPGFTRAGDGLWGLSEHPAHAPVRVPFGFSVGGGVDLVACLERAEPPASPADEVRAFLGPRKLLGTRLHVVPAASVPILVAATLHLRNGAAPGAVFGAAVERLERRFRGLDAGEGAPSPGLDAARLVALLAGVDGVEFIELPQDVPLARRSDGPVSSNLSQESAAWTFAPGVGDLRPAEVAALAGPVALRLMHRARDGKWEEVKP